MPLPAGTRLGPFEIQSPLGAGGMGEVYKARDTRLSRSVAIKVLLGPVTDDAERLARFGREAQLLAALNHPHIAQIYGLEDAGDAPALVMELVEGPTLADRIARGAIPLDEALPIARQIAEALEAAHEQGIIHRDLKPANIKIRSDGTVKVLDFGLAKALDPRNASRANPTMSPTLSMHATQQGIILGTAAYMSPEQAAGKDIDRRIDLWAFGAVFLEMLTGQQVFTGETVSHVLAAVLKSDPDWSTLPDNTPPAIRRLLRRCLEKDPRRRLDSAAVARLEIDDALRSDPDAIAPATGPRRVARTTIALALAIGTVLAGLATWAVMRPGMPTPDAPLRFAVVPAPGQELDRGNIFDRNLAVSPDGRHIAYRAGRPTTGVFMMVRSLDRLDARPLAGITNARLPFFSPDNRWIGFFDDAGLKRVSVTGGPPVTICRLTAAPRGAGWGEDNTIVFATADRATGLWRVPAGGGEPTVLTTPDAARREGDHLYPTLLPRGRGVLFTIGAPGQTEGLEIAVLDLRTGERKTLFRGGRHAEYVESGHLMYAEAGALLAVRFDLERLEVIGDPVPVVEDVMMASSGAANYAVSREGTLVYVPGQAVAETPRSLVWVDRNGREESIKAPPRAYATARLSPDGTRAAVDIRDQERDIWIWDFARNTLTPLTFGPSLDSQPVWTADGQSIIFASDRGGVTNLYRQAADGTGAVERLTTSENTELPTSVTPNGTAVVGYDNSPATLFDVVLFPLGGPAGIRRLVHTQALEQNGEISPDGRYLAYQSNESGRSEIYVRPFPRIDAGRWRVSVEGGTRPAWARDGRELFFVDTSSTLMVVPTQTSETTFRSGTPTPVFDTQYAAPVITRTYDVSPDGKRFLMFKEGATSDATARPTGIVVVLNWVEELKQKLPANN
jgi:Tol biopolymer transport system component